jgi:anti-sigma factor RsiW
MTNPCADWELLIQADCDGELDIVATARLARHIENCPACAQLQQQMLGLSRRIRDLPREAAPRHLAAGFRVAPTRKPLVPVFGGAAIGMALAASLMLLVNTAADPNAELVAGHIRALQPGHLTDVVSTDQHTVKPWFEGRIDYAPDVRDFAAAGFPLVGGRLDYIGGRPVAALIYRHAQHPIDVYVWPASGAAAPTVFADRGFNIVRWKAGGMEYVAVSDAAADDLRALARLWLERP